MLQKPIISLIFLLCAHLAAHAQEWENITADLLASIGHTAFTDDSFNRKVGGMQVMPNGDLFLVLNGDHPVYRSRNQGEKWKPLKNARTVGRAYGSFSFNLDVQTSRLAIFMIVQKKHAPAKGLVLSGKGKVLTEIGKPSQDHDGWTWGMAAWESEGAPPLILGKEHHKWVVMWTSADGGKSWEKLDFKSRNPGVIDARTFVAGNDDGIYRTADAGANWAKVSDFVVTGKNPVRYGNHFYWTTQQGVIVSKDAGLTWALLGKPLEGALWGPYFGETEQSMMVVNQEGFFITQNAGQEWRKIADFFAPPDSNREGQYDVMHPTNSYGWDEKRGILYAAGLGGDAFRLEF